VDIQSFSPEVEDFFVHFPWRGNVRELQNTIEYIANLCEHQVVTMTDLPKKLLSQNLPGNSHSSSIGSGFSVQEEEQLQSLMDKYGQTLNGKKKIAETLGISLRTLYRKMEKYQLK
jgi:transcriptional regulator with PAS, ATPase and Fis domain